MTPVTKSTTTTATTDSTTNKKARITESSNSPSSSSTNEKDNMQQMEAEFAQVREYLLRCPIGTVSGGRLGGGSGDGGVPRQTATHRHPAVRAAIDGLDKELQRRKRDAKLKAKFASAANNGTVDVDRTMVMENDENDGDLGGSAELVNVSPNNGSNGSSSNKKTRDPSVDECMTDDTDAEDWLDIENDNNNDSGGDVGSLPNGSNNTGSSCDGGGGGASNHHSDSSSTCSSSAFAKQVIALIAQQQQPPVQVKTPLGALSVALHTALLALNFKCTGLPEKRDGSGGGGFAPPVRELPPTQFLPDRWEDQQPPGGLIELRYRKQETGSVVLKVEQQQQQQQQPNESVMSSSSKQLYEDVAIMVFLHPGTSSISSSSNDGTDTAGTVFEPHLNLQLSDYINLESFNRAKQSSVTGVRHQHQQQQHAGTRIPPALHYKSLANLLARFAATFDLGGAPITTPGAVGASLPYVDTSVLSPGIAHLSNPIRNNNNINLPVSTHDKNNNNDNEDMPGSGNGRNPNLPKPRDETKPPLLHEEFPMRRPNNNMPHGDFSDDLLPCGLPPGVVGGGMSGVTGGGFMGGNLMGPNHPIFQGGGGGIGITPTGGSGITGIGPNYGMRPRFDPFGPPGGPTETHDPRDPQQQQQRRRGPPGGTGNPNPDHEPMRNAFHDNMFM